MTKELEFWFFKRDKKFTINEINELIERVKVFNAGAIDQYLTNHVDETYKKWLEEQKEK